MDIQGLVWMIQERSRGRAGLLLAHLPQWTVRAKLKALSVFTAICHAFMAHPPSAMTTSLGAYDVLHLERASFQEASAYFDAMLLEAMLLEAGIDDKTADLLDTTRQQIETILATIDRLLAANPPRLLEFH